MQIRVCEFIVFQAGGTPATGISGQPFRAGKIGGIGKGKGQSSCSRGALEQLCMGYAFLGGGLDQPLLQFSMSGNR